MRRWLRTPRKNWFGVPILGTLLALPVVLGREADEGAARSEAGSVPSRVFASDVSASARQVTVFGIQATPGKRNIDPTLREVADQLRKLLPDHGFKLLGAENKRLRVQHEITCDLGRERLLKAELLEVLDPRGKVRLKITLTEDDESSFEVAVATPPDQLFFLDKQLSDGTRLLIGVGAR